MRFLILLIITLSWFSSTAQKAHTGCRFLKNGIHYATEKAVSNADSVHVVHYDIYIDSVGFSSNSLWARTNILAESLVDGLSHVQLDLQNMTVDSVVLNLGGTLDFSHDGLALDITVPNLNPTETVEFTVHYHGEPGQDPSWGGFYWLGNLYAYNMGVGFDEDPHVYGRAWYPCMDVFTDRSTYDFYVTVDSAYMPVCNGEMVGQTDMGNGQRTTHWQMSQPIPSYLSAIAIAEYELLEREYSGIPAIFAAVSSDTNAVNATFANMQACVDKFVDSYGPYRFNRIGYTLVPFSGGAMEHASSIHIGRPFVDGTLTYETLWAHELAHMWWGDNVTCASAEDMWLNEGWAAYSEGLFTEAVYGHEAYMDWYRALHRDILQFAHITDGDYYAMNNIPHNITYGSHVYDKGPLVCHSLRGYMGDSLFFVACQAYHDSLTMGNASSIDLQNIFSEASGIDMSGIFNGFVFEPGWGHFSVDSFSVTPIPDVFQVAVSLRQRSRANSHLYQMNVPIYFADGFGNDTTLWVPMDDWTQGFTVHINFEPRMAIIDGEEELSDAMADLMLNIETTGLHNFLHTNVKLDVSNAGQGGSIVRVADNFVSAEMPITPEGGLFPNMYHYWSVEGILGQDFQASAEFKYNGSTSTSVGYMDNDLFTVFEEEENLKMFFRASPGHQWAELDTLNYEVATGANTSNSRGSIDVFSVDLGEYLLVMSDPALGIAESENSGIQVYPNPATDYINISLNGADFRNATVQVFDVSGRLCFDSAQHDNNLGRVVITTDTWQSGTYLITITAENGERFSEKVEVK